MRQFFFAMPALAFTLGATTLAQADFLYTDFSTATDITLNGDATINGALLRMTVAGVTSQAATAWHNNSYTNLGNGFTMTAVFRTEGNTETGTWGPDSGADGLAFAFQSDSLNALGGSGGDNGVIGIPNAIVVSFRTFWNDIQFFQLDGSGNQGPVVSESFDFVDGRDYVLGVQYDPIAESFFVTVDGDTYLTANFGTGDFGTDPLYVGLGSGTGAANGNNDVSKWSLEVVPEPATIAVLGLGALAVARRKTRKTDTQ